MLAPMGLSRPSALRRWRGWMAGPGSAMTEGQWSRPPDPSATLSGQPWAEPGHDALGTTVLPARYSSAGRMQTRRVIERSVSGAQHSGRSMLRPPRQDLAGVHDLARIDGGLDP